MSLQPSHQKETRRMRQLESLILFGFGLVMVVAPLLFRSEEDIDWPIIFRHWQNITPYFVLLLIHHFWTVPQLLFRKRRKTFIAVALVMIGTMAVYKHLTRPLVRPDFDRPPIGLFDPGPPNDAPPPEFRRHNGPPPPDFQRPKEIFPPLVNTIAISLLLLLLDTGYRATFRLIQSEHNQVQLEKENVHHRLSFLKNQISPHFFMNTLNNVHALIAIDPGQAQEAVIKLSKLMRAMLDEPATGKIALSDEIVFQKNYIELMSLRFTDKLDLKAEFPQEVPEVQIPPMLFTSLIENAFKYGVSYKAPSFIHIFMRVENGNLYYEMTNSNHKNDTQKSSGIGLSNTRDRLNLLYPQAYQLEIEDQPEIFKLKLTLPL